ncbi:hypothetical protein VB774_05780 [Pseudanabaena galeata UHCC 0370]|uniref:Uncharacterized protein n=1 Tax=Pseudanabaena galeata UHCC 0370 TaxID=3110310 RepID=A0ABU5TGD0_9CYAN|nr:MULTISPECIES: hypothetical protein [Pseudanabaena]MEA5477126.1 hypothetical protein [Pseudanabaena galeata UHCC 0370]MEA5486769.1 hypothetical protein [Pseudanabaena sp. CCNP1317]WGS71126.1 hypothetical protein OA858_15535 [Pseudanabaena galeata CCNP1313]
MSVRYSHLRRALHAANGYIELTLINTQSTSFRSFIGDGGIDDWCGLRSAICRCGF